MILEIYPLINKYGMSSNIYGSMVVIYMWEMECVSTAVCDMTNEERRRES